MNHDFVLTLKCHERSGIVHAVTSFLIDHGCDITEHQQFDDAAHGHLFLRTAFRGYSEDTELTVEILRADFSTVAAEFEMDWQIHDASRQTRTLVMVSKFSHCLNDLLYRWETGALDVDLALVVSNHEDLRPMTEAAGVPFVHLPITASTRAVAESQMLDLVDKHDIDLIILARYMQVLSDDLCAKLARPGHQHPPLVPAQFQGRQALPPGLCPRCQTGRSYCALRHSRPG